MPEWVRSLPGKLLPKLNLGRMFNSQDPTLEANLAAYVFGVLVMAFVVVWWDIKGTRDGNLVAALGVFAAAITGGLFKKGSNAAQPTQATGTEDKDGGA